MIFLSILTILMAMGLLQYSLEKGHPRLVITLEVLAIAISVIVILSISIWKNIDAEQTKNTAHKNLVDSIYATGYRKGLMDCNKK